MAIPADTRDAPCAHPSNQGVTQSGTFDPASWLLEFENVGGGYSFTDAALHLVVAVCEGPAKCPAASMLASLADDHRAVLQRYLENNQLCSKAVSGSSRSGPPTAELPAEHGEEPSNMNMMTAIRPAFENAEVNWSLPDDWQSVVARYETDSAVFTRHAYARTATDDPDYERLHEENSALMDVSEASLRKLIAMPAPDLAALARKMAIVAYEYGDADGVLGALMTDTERLAAKRAEVADSAIVAAWEHRKAAYARYNALPDHGEGEAPDYLSPAERAEWAIINEAEETIRAAIAKTPSGVAIQLWTALRYCVTSNKHEEAVHRRDIAALEAVAEELNDQGNWLVAALRSLNAMGAHGFTETPAIEDMAWDAAMQAFERASAQFAVYLPEYEALARTSTGGAVIEVANNRLESLGDAEHQAQWALMDMPAPHMAALRWKLEYLLDTDSGDGVQPWSKVAVAQTVADLRRLA